MKCISIDELNRLSQTPEKLIAEGEALYSSQLCAAAEKIYAERKERPVVLISGPSGSGKTTSATRLAHKLREMGCATHTISMDNYYLSAEENEAARDENGNIDFESPYRLDMELFQAHLESLMRREEVIVPEFDFAAQERREGIKLKRGENDLVILEGIHALNPLVTGHSDDFTNCIYVSVRTRICAENGDMLHPSKIRLMRRLLRDRLYRGRSFAETFEFFKSVEQGEQKYIMPFKHRAEIEIDTFIEYEASVYRDFLLPGLSEASNAYRGYSDYADIERFLNLLLPVDSAFVPNNSIVREFIGF